MMQKKVNDTYTKKQGQRLSNELIIRTKSNQGRQIIVAWMM